MRGYRTRGRRATRPPWATEPTSASSPQPRPVRRRWRLRMALSNMGRIRVNGHDGDGPDRADTPVRDARPPTRAPFDRDRVEAAWTSRTIDATRVRQDRRPERAMNPLGGSVVAERRATGGRHRRAMVGRGAADSAVGSASRARSIRSSIWALSNMGRHPSWVQVGTGGTEASRRCSDRAPVGVAVDGRRVSPRSRFGAGARDRAPARSDQVVAREVGWASVARGEQA